MTFLETAWEDDDDDIKCLSYYYSAKLILSD